MANVVTEIPVVLDVIQLKVQCRFCKTLQLIHLQIQEALQQYLDCCESRPSSDLFSLFVVHMSRYIWYHSSISAGLLNDIQCFNAVKKTQRKKSEFEQDSPEVSRCCGTLNGLQAYRLVLSIDTKNQLIAQFAVFNCD